MILQFWGDNSLNTSFPPQCVMSANLRGSESHFSIFAYFHSIIIRFLESRSLSAPRWINTNCQTCHACVRIVFMWMWWWSASPRHSCVCIVSESTRENLFGLNWANTGHHSGVFGCEEYSSLCVVCGMLSRATTACAHRNRINKLFCGTCHQ